MIGAAGTGAQSLDPLSRALAFAGVALGLFLYLGSLDGAPVQRGNEAMYLFPPIQMLESGDWLVTRYQGKPFLDKPPLAVWIIAASYRVFGVSVFAARLPTALAALAAAALLGAWVKRRAGPRAGWIAGLALLFSFGLFFSGMTYAADTFLALTVLLAAILVERAVLQESGSDAALGSLAGAALALAFYSKGLVGIVLPVGAAGLSLLLDRRRPVRPLARAAWAAAVLLLLIAPWHVAMTARLGEQFWRVFYWENQVLRGATERYMKVSRGPLYYLPILAGAIFPWSLFVPAALKRRRPSSLPVALLLFGFVFLSLLTMKREVYLLPVLPAVAALAAESADDGGRAASLWRRAVWILAAAGAAGVLALWTYGFSSMEPVAGRGSTVALGAALAVLLVAFAVAAAAPRRTAALLGAAFALGLVCLTLEHLYERVARFDPLPEWGRRVRSECAAGCDVFLVGQDSTSLDFYSRLDWLWLDVPFSELPSRMRHSTAFVVLWTDLEPRLKDLALAWTVVDRRAAIGRYSVDLIGQSWTGASRSMSLVRVDRPR